MNHKEKTGRAPKSKDLKSIATLIGLVAFILLFVVALSILIDSFIPQAGPMGPRSGFTDFRDRIDLRSALEFRENFQFIGSVLTSINILLLLYLLLNYISIYYSVKSNFSLGLIIIATALLAHSISSNPIVAQFFGFRGEGLGPFTIIPAIFTLIAAAALIYLSRQ